jgi:outer membrane receptor protein involved in Fe transport
MENIDYAFMSPLLTDSSGVLKIFGYNGDPPFDAVKEFREQNKGMATILVDTRLARRFMKEDQASISLVIKNLLNQTYEIRPALIAPSRSYAIQFSYKF